MDDFFSPEDLHWLLRTFLYLACGLSLFLFGKILFGQIHRKINISDELVQKDNVAFSIAYVGYFIGVLLAVGGTIVGTSYGLTTDMINIAVFGVLTICLLNASSWVNDKFILHQFSVAKEIIEDRNAGTGVIEAANYIASGLVIYGAVSGQSPDFFPDSDYGVFLSGILSVIIFWFIGQVLMLLTTKIYSLILPYDVHYEIERDNVAAGIGFAGAMIALAILISYGITGDFEGWGSTIAEIAIDVTLGIVMLPLMRWIADEVLLPGEKLTDEIINQQVPNIGAAFVEAFAYIGSAILIVWCM